MARRVGLSYFILTAGLGLATAAIPVSGVEPVHEIRLLNRRFTPPAGVPETARQAIGRRAEELRARGKQRLHLLVQLHARPSPAGHRELARQGFDLGAYVPGSAFIAAVPVGRAVAAAMSPEVRWATLWETGHKLHPRVAAGDWAPWTRDPVRPEMVAVMLLLHHDVPLEAGPVLAAEVDGIAMPAIEGLHGMTVWLPQTRVAELAAEEEVLWIEEAPPPLTPTNDRVKSGLSGTGLADAPYGLTGSGVRLFVFDVGTVRETHQTFDPGTGSRVTPIDGTPMSSHATHVAGTAAGDGSGSTGDRGRGVAPGVSVLSAGYEQVGGTMFFWDNAGDIEADYALARTVYQADLGTNSLVSNTANDDDAPCDRVGDYGVSSSLIDNIVHGTNAAVESPVFMTWAAGNERNSGDTPGRCGSNYGTTAPPSCAKNPLHVGAINSDGLSMTEFSSWGPCDDGRLKPTVVAPGCESEQITGEPEAGVYSSIDTSDSAYGFSCGTSMATPAVAGVASLLLQAWREEGFGGPTERPLPALIKAILIHTARDLGLAGPDYIHGYGAVDAKAAVDLLRESDNLTRGWIIGTVEEGEILEHYINGPWQDLDEAKVTLVWDDPAAAPFAAEALVNDLTLEYGNSNSPAPYQPWVLDPVSPHLPATTGVDSRNNVEQIVVRDAPMSDTLMRVIGTRVPSGSQSYALVFSFKPAEVDKTACTGMSSTFETGTDGWTLSDAVRTLTPVSGHGTQSVRLGGTVETVHDATRAVVVPIEGRTELTFWWHMTTEESLDLFGFGFDRFTAEIRNSSGAVLAVVDLRNDGWPQGRWLQQRIDMMPWVGQKVTLAFTATNDFEAATTFWIDDVTVTSCPRICSSGGSPSIQVIPGDDPPTAVDDATTVAEDSGASAIDVLANDTDIDGGPRTIASITQPANGTVAITDCGTRLTYVPSPNYCNSQAGSLPDTFSYALSPGGSTPTVSVQVTCVNDPPMADNDRFDFVGNTELRVDLAAVATPHALATTPTTFGVLDGDSDPGENDPIFVAGIVGCADVTAPFVCPLAGIGTISMEVNGRFSFVPEAGDSGTIETFQYTLSDDQATVNATVTLTRFERVWYVKNDAAAGGLGRSADPFDTLAEAQTASLANDYIFVYFGDGTAMGQSAGIALKNVQRLIGQHAGLSIPHRLNGNGFPTNLVAAAPGSRPLLTNTVVGGFEGVVSARDVIPAVIVGLSLAGNVNAIDWTTTPGFAGAGGTFSIRDNVILSATNEGVDINLAGTGKVQMAFHDNNLTASGTALDIQETGTGSLIITAFDDNVVSGNTGGSGIVINSATFTSNPAGLLSVEGGTTVIGASGNPVTGAGLVLNAVSGMLRFNNLSIFAGGGAGLSLTGTGAIDFDKRTGTKVGTPTGIIEAASGPAVDINNATIVLPLSRLTSTNSPTTGVSLVNVSKGSDLAVFSAGAGSSITNPTETGFNIDGGDVKSSYAGTISSNTGRAVSVTNHGGRDPVTFTGAITNNGTGVFLNANGDSTVYFSGGLTLSTGANAAFTATGGGWVTVIGTANTIETTTGTALNATNSMLGGLTFRSISSNGGTNAGIILNNTGTNNGLTVTGTGAPGTGGTIQNKAIGISLTNTRNPSFGWMQLNDFGDFAIRGSSVVNFTLANSVINGTNGNDAGANEGSVRFTELTGSATISNCNISGGVKNNFSVVNTGGVLDRITFSNTTFGANSTATGDDGLLIEGHGPRFENRAIVKTTVTGSTFTSARGDHFQLNLLGFTFSDLVFTGNTISNSHPAVLSDGGGIRLTDGRTGSNDTATYNISGNTLRDSNGTAIGVTTGAGAGLTGTIDNNQIGVAGIANSGSTRGSGISVIVADTASNTTTIANNQIRQYNNFGILVQTGSPVLVGSGTLKATVTGNTISNPGTLVFAKNGFQLNSGALPGEIYEVCLIFGGAGALRNNLVGSGTNGGTDFLLRQLQSTTVRLLGYSGAGSDDAALVSFAQVNNNLGGTPTGSASNTYPAGGWTGVCF